MKRSVSRREMIESCIVKGLLVAAAPLAQPKLLEAWQAAEAGGVKQTPAEVLGPFFKKGAPNTAKLRNTGEAGVPLRIFGKVSNTRGEPVTGAQIDVWHADHYGRYDLKAYRY